VVGVNNVPIVGEPLAYGTGFFVLVFLGLSAFLAQYVLTYAHEGGHMLAAVLTFRGLLRYTIADDRSGLTTTPAKPWAVSTLLFLAAGYLAPPLLGLGGAALIAAHNPYAVLLIAAFFSLLALVPARNALAFTIPFLVLVGIVLALVKGSPTTQATVAVSVVWFLLIGGIFDTTTLPVGGGDAASLAGKTLIPGVLWKIFWVGVAVLALIVGGQLLLRPGYAIH
jgi:hypothetical protein